MTCCYIPDSVRYCNNCGHLIAIDTQSNVMRFVDESGLNISECPSCNYWLSEHNTHAPNEVRPISVSDSVA